VNNELPGARNATYARNLASLDTLVLVLFEQDTTVVPKESAWFGAEAEPGDAAHLPAQVPLAAARPVVPMRRQPLYTEDWIGLRTLDERGAVIFETCAGQHMHIGDCWEPLVRKYIGGPA
jgi:palmitoyl-protein thioesterase